MLIDTATECREDGHSSDILFPRPIQSPRLQICHSPRQRKFQNVAHAQRDHPQIRMTSGKAHGQYAAGLADGLPGDCPRWSLRSPSVRGVGAQEELDSFLGLLKRALFPGGQFALNIPVVGLAAGRLLDDSYVRTLLEGEGSFEGRGMNWAGSRMLPPTAQSDRGFAVSRQG